MPRNDHHFTWYRGVHGDRIVVRFTTENGAVLTFSVQYELLLYGHWRPVVRYDSSHGQPHRHTFYRNGEERRTNMAYTNNNAALTYAEVIAKAYYLKWRERYLNERS